MCTPQMPSCWAQCAVTCRVDFSDEVIAFEEQIKEDFGHLADTAMSFSHAVVRAPLDEFFGGEWLYLSPGCAPALAA